MAQRAIININGDLIPFSEELDRIRTPGLGGSAVTWVPDADTICDQLKVTANGTYSATEAGKYGYDYVVVSVPGSSVTGRDPDTGEEVEVHPDPETGEIVTTVLPTEIRVITPPTKTDYADGETIDYSGIVVHAYSSTGTDLGVVQFNELVFPIITAVYDTAKYQPDQATVNDTSFLYNNPPVSLPVLIGYGNIYHTAEYNPTYYEESRIEIIESNDIVYGFCYGYQDYEAFNITLCSKEPFEFRVVKTIHNEYHNPPDWDDITRYNVTKQRIHNRTRRFHYSNGAISVSQDQYKNTHYMTDGPIMWVNSANLLSNTNLINDTIEVILYGTILPGGNPIPVQWPRTPDGAVLETTTTINVTGGST